MQITLTGRVLEIYSGDKSANVTLLDIDTGGNAKINFPVGRVPAILQVDQKVKIEAFCQPKVTRFGLMLNIREGANIQKAD